MTKAIVTPTTPDACVAPAPSATRRGLLGAAVTALPLAAVAALAGSVAPVHADPVPPLFRRMRDLQGRADALGRRCRELHAALVATHGEPDESRFWAWDDGRLAAYRALMTERGRLDAAAAEARGELLIAAPTTPAGAALKLRAALAHVGQPGDEAATWVRMAIGDAVAVLSGIGGRA